MVDALTKEVDEGRHFDKPRGAAKELGSEDFPNGSSF